MLRRIRHPSPAMVIALLALFFAMGGAAGAVTAVPLAKRALVADNAKRLNNKSAREVAALPSPALISVATGSASIPAQDANYFTVSCDSGQRAISGGFTTSAAIIASDTYPVDDSTWRMFLINLGTSSATATTYAVCIAAPPGDSTTFTPVGTRTDAARKSAAFRNLVRPR